MKKIFLIILALGGIFITSLLGMADSILAKATTQPPQPISPCNDQTVSSLVPRLEWQSVNGAWLYEWEVFLLKDGKKWQLVDSGGTSSSATPPTYGMVKPDSLKPDNNYQWHARSQDKNYNKSDWGEWCKFNTKNLQPITVTPGEPTIVGINPKSGPVGTAINITGENFACATYTAKKNTVIFTGDNGQTFTDNSPQCDGLFTLKTVIPNFPESVKTITIQVQVDSKTSKPDIFSVGSLPSTPTPGGSAIIKGKLEVNWPSSPMGTPLNDNSKLVDLIKYLYEWGIGIGGFLAFIALVIAGFQYLTSAGNAGMMKDAMDRIRSAGLGLILLLGSFLILNTINPQLTELKMPTFEAGSKSPSIEEPRKIGIPTEECRGATLYSGTNLRGTSQEILIGETLFSPKKTIGSVDMKGDCSMLLFQISGSCTENSDRPAIPVSGDTSDIGLRSSGVTEFSCAKLIDLSFKTPAIAP